MAARIEAGEYKRQDVLLIDPEFIKVDFTKRGRRRRPPQEAIIKLAYSILKHGQKQHGEIRKLHDATVELTFGFTRYEAVCYANEYLIPEGGNKLKFKCTLVNCNEEEALLHNIIENRMRNETTAIDDAHNMRRLQEHFAFTDDRVAETYDITVARVSQLRKLLTLSSDIQDKISDGIISTAAALELCGLPAEEQVQVIQEAETVGTNVTATNVRKAKRKSATATGDASRSMKEVRSFFEGLTGPGEEEKIKEFAKASLAFLKGKSSEKVYENAIHRLHND